MVDVLKQLSVANIFIILFNGQQPRYDEPLQSMLTTLVEVSLNHLYLNSYCLTPSHIFGKEFLNHTILGFSRWAFDIYSKRRRQRDNTNEELRTANYAGK